MLFTHPKGILTALTGPQNVCGFKQVESSFYYSTYGGQHLLCRWNPRINSIYWLIWVWQLTLPNPHLENQAMKSHILIIIFLCHFGNRDIFRYFKTIWVSDIQTAFHTILGCILSKSLLDAQGELKGIAVPFRCFKCKKGSWLIILGFGTELQIFIVYVLFLNLVKLFCRTYRS